METSKSFESQLYGVNEHSFKDIALSLFHFQAQHNPVYSAYIQNLSISSERIESLDAIPFLPISFFKRHSIKTGDWKPQTKFSSSGTTGITTSTHHVKDLRFYTDHAERCFNSFFGEITDYHFLALLPSYMERRDSSLIAMMDHFIKRSKSPFSGFYLNNTNKLLGDLENLRSDKRKTIFWGVSFALLDLAEKFKPDLSHCLVFETGGMKGTRKEITRQELQSVLQKGLNLRVVFSEYGMTELFSQAYTKGEDRFYSPPWMKVFTREITDPFQPAPLGETGGINVIDLANINTMAFIETEDIGKVYADGSFEIVGRMDNSDVRGCNLMLE